MPDAAVENPFRASGTGSVEPNRGAGYAVYDPVGEKIGGAEEAL